MARPSLARTLYTVLGYSATGRSIRRRYVRRRAKKIIIESTLGRVGMGMGVGRRLWR